MQNKMNITLYDQEGKELIYSVEQLFSLEGNEQLYCCAVSLNEKDVVFLKCDMKKVGEDVEMTVSTIKDEGEYSRVAAAYQEQPEEDPEQAEDENLAGPDDIIILRDKLGNEITFVVHLIFEDKFNHREYIAAQEVDAAGNVSEVISLYRFRQTSDEDETGTVSAEIEMIPSDMEYERARSLFLDLIEAGSAPEPEKNED